MFITNQPTSHVRRFDLATVDDVKGSCGNVVGNAVKTVERSMVSINNEEKTGTKLTQDV